MDDETGADCRAASAKQRRGMQGEARKASHCFASRRLDVDRRQKSRLPRAKTTKALFSFKFFCNFFLNFVLHPHMHKILNINKINN